MSDRENSDTASSVEAYLKNIRHDVPPADPAAAEWEVSKRLSDSETSDSETSDPEISEHIFDSETRAAVEQASGELLKARKGVDIYGDPLYAPVAEIMSAVAPDPVDYAGFKPWSREIKETSGDISSVLEVGRDEQQRIYYKAEERNKADGKILRTAQFTAEGRGTNADGIYTPRMTMAGQPGEENIVSINNPEAVAQVFTEISRHMGDNKQLAARMREQRQNPGEQRRAS